MVDNSTGLKELKVLVLKGDVRALEMNRNLDFLCSLEMVHLRVFAHLKAPLGECIKEFAATLRNKIEA